MHRARTGSTGKPGTLLPEKNKKDSAAAERAVLVGLILPGQEIAGTRYDPLAELAGLASAAGAEVVGRMIQKRPKICPATYIGTGKVKALADYVEDKEADLIIFDNELAPSQIREVEQIAKRRVIDRTELILDIFASRARTHSARLQVELAQLEYTAPRLRGMWTHLERIAGAGGGTAAGAVGAIGTRGPGERQIEIDRRIVQKRVTMLKEQLAQIDKRKLREVESRSDHFTISLVGYTNAGKSTLMNALTDAGTLVEDKLFATLDTKTRRWNLGGGQSALLSDTVGFVRNLPHHLVASFRATLEETINSDLLIHVVDASSHDAVGQARAVDRVLEELGCRETARINVLNKIDVLGDDSEIQLLRASMPEAVEISAATGAGLAALHERVIARLRGRYTRVMLEASASNGKLLAYLSRHGHILDRQYDEGMVRLDVRVPTQELPRILQMGAVQMPSA
ncbi:MAG: GTPase HflX [Phycisphaerales bacterium]|nr:GTPase HflX [Phycisphaerales bacterium]MCB9864826.1 GTPase HflX [Phycisphaerales bacterium]